jgi:hypothetical protein
MAHSTSGRQSLSAGYPSGEHDILSGEYDISNEAPGS